MMNRRDFLRGSAVGLVATAMGTRPPESLFGNPYNKPVGVQLYTVRDDLEKGVRGTITKVAQIGYKEVEVYDLYGMTAKAFGQILKDNGLTTPSGHYMTKHIKGDWHKHIADAKELGMKYMVNAILEPEERKSFDDYKRLVELFNKAAEPVQKAGMTYAYHNHNFEFKKYDDTTAYDYLLKNLEPKIQFEMDCFWVTHAGLDPVALFRKHPGRFPLLHIKDLKDKPAPTQELDAKMGLFAEVGSGTINWKRIFAAAPKGGMKHFYVEQDYCERPVLESIKMSYEYLHSLQV
jgi:sugar phosphate isomerase/epimerase